MTPQSNPGHEHPATTGPVLTTVAELVRDRADGRPVRVLDVRWSLAEPDGRPAYRAGHVPGAVLVDLETQLSRRPEPGEGRHPLDRKSVV